VRSENFGRLRASSAGMRHLLPCLLLLLLTGCPPAKPQTGTSTGKSVAGATKFSVALLRTDLGLADGQYVREADAALSELAIAGAISLTVVGELPAPLQEEGSTSDVALPDEELTPGVPQAGIMTLAQAEALAGQLGEADLIVLGGSVVLPAMLKRIEAGELKCRAVLLLDGDGPPVPATTPVPVHALRYDVTHSAFLLGVAAATSSNTQNFIAFTSVQDPDREDFLDGLFAGLRYRTGGAQLISAELQPDAQNLVTPEDYKAALERIRQRGAGSFRVNHYIVAAGRVTPSVMYALSSDPTSAYVLGGWADFTQVRPAKVVCCGEKHPGGALAQLFDGAASLNDVLARLSGGMVFGIDSGAADVTDFTADDHPLYDDFNPDGVDIREAIETARGEILAGELDVEALIEEHKADRISVE
jgi:hypothetical protein